MAFSSPTLPTSSQARHLARSAKLLSLASPATSAYLASLHSQLPHGKEQAKSDILDLYCLACGTVGSHVETVWPKTRNSTFKRNSRSGLKESRITARILSKQCKTCCRRLRTVLEIPPRAPAVAPIAKSSTNEHLKSSYTLPVHHAQQNDAMSSNKKRSKGRKDRAGLQAILEKSKQDSKPTTNFNLLDFMT